jgi:hypothetical protein
LVFAFLEGVAFLRAVLKSATTSSTSMLSESLPMEISARRTDPPSFEALRATILFTEGAHKHQLRRPKFERMHKVEPDYGIPADAMGYCVFVTEPPNNYGADINTQITLLEAGKL